MLESVAVLITVGSIEHEFVERVAHGVEFGVPCSSLALSRLIQLITRHVPLLLVVLLLFCPFFRVAGSPANELSQNMHPILLVQIAIGWVNPPLKVSTTRVRRQPQ
jgi:hypothetical protein